ncbi:MAG: SGNH/GDSL hydrolase family protein [Candidatus Pacebacteria bacterium]|nr:SGNH/GDSL hydrolase family protein [Candidatus Paceibacterota bacterium]
MTPGSSSECCMLREAHECSPRGGLPNFFAHLERGGNITVAYLGGSITAQSGWRVQSLAYFQEHYPQATLTEVNAAIGGTGSLLGVFRLEHDVLRYEPDLVFVEFAVNDSNTNPESVVQSMEGIVRKTWNAYALCDICFVYTLTGKLLPDLQNGKFPKITTVMETIADHYDIPSIHMGLEVARLEKEGQLVMRAANSVMTRVSGKELDVNAHAGVDENGKIPFAPDAVHPYSDTGHKLYTQAIIRSLPPIKAVATNPVPHALPAPIDPNNLEQTVMAPIDQARMTGPWRQLDGDLMGFAKRLPCLWRGEPGARLSFQFTGSTAMIYHLLGPDCGKLEVTVDGTVSHPLCIDPYCTYHRLAILPVANNLNSGKTHKVEIKVLADKLDKKEILFERNRAHFEANPHHYTATNWYAGAIFLVGTLS